MRNYTATLFPMRLRAVLRRLALTNTPAQIEPPHDLVLQSLADGIRYERAGDPDRALACYGIVAGAATDPAVASRRTVEEMGWLLSLWNQMPVPS